jgi:hypothetical protein
MMTDTNKIYFQSEMNYQVENKRKLRCMRLEVKDADNHTIGKVHNLLINKEPVGGLYS